MPTVERDVGAMLLGRIEGYSLFQVGSGCSQRPKKEQGGPQRMVGLQEEGWILYASSQGVELLSQLTRRL
jgi:hypothetical protein